ncbi:MAG TPA: UDP-forming cellulose synthase catalytic subunit [Polyangia bacterium]|nr:UDP-forming cellulose synthase catalytic subunit [Polyangia bacterium]
MKWLALSVRIVLAALAVVFLAVVVVTPLDVGPQLLLGGAAFALALVVRNRNFASTGPLLTMFSIVASSRYIWWRVSSTIDFDSTTDRILGLSLLGAELYAFAVLLLGAFQTLYVLQRKPAPLPADRAAWPTVDVFIPTYNEPLEVVRPTVLAALRIDWPADKLRVHLLDDGSRPAFRDFAGSVKVNYIIRAEHKHAKAGNLNHALKITDGELIVIFDSDHIATRSFLQLTVGWFLRDRRLGMLQTPHHFYNPDPIERNLGQFRRVPNEGELFYSYLQSGNDFWNATFFCGSCAIIRRSVLEEVGGIATDSLTEDALTSLRFQRLGYRTAYLNVRQAGGLATDTLAAHIGQRVRWAQGMCQILRVSNPLVGRGLSIGQRLCYLNASVHFLYGLPRLIFLLGPLAYLIFGAHICTAAPAMLLAYLLPHLVHAMLVDTHTRRRFRYAFWNNVYETVLAVYILVPTLIALLRPRAGVFKVTDKGQIAEGGFDRRIARPYLILLLFNVAGVALALMRLILWDYYDSGTVLLNLAWALFSIFSLGAVLAVACESRQLRRTHRLPMKLAAILRTESGHAYRTQTRDLSLGGASLQWSEPLPAGEKVELALQVGSDEHWLPARTVGSDEGRLRLAFDGLSVGQESDLVHTLFGRPDAWIDWEQGRPADRPLASLRTLTGQSVRGMRTALKAEPRVMGGALAAALAVAVCFLLSHTGWRLQPAFERASALGVMVSERLRSAADMP